MPNIAKVLKAEIMRISRKEAKGATEGIGQSNTWLKKIVADLKRRVLLLEKGNKALVASIKRYQTQHPETPPEETKKVRFTSKGIRSLRSRLRLTQADFAKLVGTSAHSVYLWETREGVLKLRDKTREAFLSIRGLGAREAKEKLAELGKKLKGRKEAASKKRKRS
jgi:DNA-binding transcriptional regulator YiaG